MTYLRSHWPMAGLLTMAIFLLCSDLGQLSLWDDEAAVAVLARNFVRQGKMTGLDGHNLYSYRNATNIDSNFLSLEPPLPQYVTAAAFAMWGISAVSARLLFAWMGVGSVAMVYAICLRMLPGRNVAAWLASALCLSNVQFLLYCRECRYYAAATLLTLLMIYFYLGLMQNPSRRGVLGLVVSGYLLFITQFMVAFCVAAGLGGWFLLERNNLPQSRRIWLLIAFSSLALCCSAYTFLYPIFDRKDIDFNYQGIGPSLFMRYCYLRDSNIANIFPIYSILAFCLNIFYLRDKTALLTMRRLAWFSVVVIFTLFWVTPQPYYPMALANRGDIRYLYQLTPVSMLILGIGFSALLQQYPRQKGWWCFLCLLCASSNVLSMPSFSDLHMYWYEYLVERTHRYPSSTQEVAKYLLALPNHASQHVALVPDYNLSSLMYLTDDQIHYCCLLDHHSQFEHHTLLRKTMPQLYAFQTHPDLIVLFGNAQYVPTAWLEWFARVAQKPYHLVKTLPIYSYTTHRSEIIYRHFSPKWDFDITQEAVYIFAPNTI